MAESAVGDLSDLESTLSEAPKHFLWEVCASARAAALVFVWAATTRQNGTRARDAATAGSHDSSGQHEKDGAVVHVAGRGVMPSLPPEIVRLILEMYPKKAMICNATLRFATPGAPLMACSRCRGVWCVRHCMHTLHTRSSATDDHACGHAYISHSASRCRRVWCARHCMCTRALDSLPNCSMCALTRCSTQPPSALWRRTLTCLWPCAWPTMHGVIHDHCSHPRSVLSGHGHTAACHVTRALCLHTTCVYCMHARTTGTRAWMRRGLTGECTRSRVRSSPMSKQVSLMTCLWKLY
jgi:hypothetical protein